MDEPKKGDVVQLICSTAWHKVGELAVVYHVLDSQCMAVIYEGEEEAVPAIIQNFRIVKLKLLRRN